MSALKTQSGAARALVVIDYLQVIPIPDSGQRSSELYADKYQVRVAQDILAGMRQAESSLLGDALIAISETRKPATGRKHWGEDLADLMGRHASAMGRMLCCFIDGLSMTTSWRKSTKPQAGQRHPQ
jgi:hypothetical protein